MNTKIIAISIAAFIGIVVLASVLMPILNDATDTEDTFTNEGLYYMEKVTADSDKEWTLEFTKSPYSFTINGTEIDTSDLNSSLRYTFATDGDNWLIRFTNTSVLGFAYVAGTYSLDMANVVAETITISGGTVSVSATMTDSSTVSKTATYTDMWIYSLEETDWVMKAPDKPAYMLDDSNFYGFGTTSISHWYDFIGVIGTVSDFDAEILYPEVTTTVTNESITQTDVSNYVGLHKLDNVKFTISDGTNTANATYSYFIVPHEVTAELSQHLTDGQNKLLLVIPMLIIVAILLGVIALVIRSRME